MPTYARANSRSYTAEIERHGELDGALCHYIRHWPCGLQSPVAPPQIDRRPRIGATGWRRRWTPLAGRLAAARGAGC